MKFKLYNLKLPANLTVSIWSQTKKLFHDQEIHRVLLELSLELFHNALINLERLSKNITANIWFGSKNSIIGSYYTRILAAQSRDRNCISIPNIALVMQQPNWENKHITLVEGLGDVPVLGVWAHKPDLEGALQDRKDLGGSGVEVGDDDPLGGIVDPGQCET